MAWVKVDDKFSSGPKVKRAAAVLGGSFPRRRVLSVWLEALSYCNLHTTNGFIPDYEIATFEDENPTAVIEAMAVGDRDLKPIMIREKKRNGWMVYNYLKYQPSREMLEEKQDKERERKAAFRARVSQKCPNGTKPDGAKASDLPEPNRTEPARTEPKNERSRASADDFAVCWAAYPRKIGKGAALRAWEKQKPPRAEVLSALQWQRTQPQWVKDDGQFVPHMATWLNQRRWEDEPFEPTNAPLSDPNEAAWDRVNRKLGLVVNS